VGCRGRGRLSLLRGPSWFWFLRLENWGVVQGFVWGVDVDGGDVRIGVGIDVEPI